MAGDLANVLLFLFLLLIVVSGQFVFVRGRLAQAETADGDARAIWLLGGVGVALMFGWAILGAFYAHWSAYVLFAGAFVVEVVIFRRTRGRSDGPRH